MAKPDYNKSLVSLSSSLLAYYGVTPHHPPLDALAPFLAKRPNHLIVILFDGLGINILKKHKKVTPTLNSYLYETISSVHPPTTHAATTALLSGKTPLETAWIGWVQRNAETGDFIIPFLNRDYYDHGKRIAYNFAEEQIPYRSILHKIAARHPQLAVTSIWPDFMADGCRTFGAEVDRLLAINQSTGASFTYCYWNHPDSTIHMHGVGSQKTAKVLAEIDAEFKRLLAGVSSDTLIIVTADHGIIDVEPVRLYEDAEIATYLRCKPSLESRTAAFYVKPGAEAAFEQYFRVKYGKDFLLIKPEAAVLAGLFGEGVAHPRFFEYTGDYLALATGKKSFFTIEEALVKATHAGATREEYEIPLIIVAK